MPLSPEEIEGKHFLMALRGYDKDQVDAFLRELAAEQQALLHSAEAVREAREAGGPRTGPDPFDGFAAQLESILRHAAEQADHIRSAAADDVARQLEAARRELVKAGTIRAAAEQEAAEARRELENARSVTAEAERQAAETMEHGQRQLHDLKAEMTAAAQRVDDLREAAAEQGARAAELRQSAQQHAGELRQSAEREAAEVREIAGREAAEVVAAAERQAAEVREIAEREAAELRDAADWACQHSARVLEAAEEELGAALQLRAEREQELGLPPAAQPSDHAQPDAGARADRGDPSRATTSRSWFPFSDD